MNCLSRCFNYLPQGFATLIGVLFAVVNTMGAGAEVFPQESDQIFKAFLQGHCISLPLFFLPLVMLCFTKGGFAAIRGWFARPNCSFRIACRLVLVMILLGFALATSLDAMDEQGTVTLFKRLVGWQTFIIALLIGGVVPIVEELFFRGVLLHRLPSWWAVPVSAVIFAFAHGTDTFLFPLFFTGWMLAMIRVRTESLWIPIACHMGFNSLSLMLALVHEV